MIEILRLSFFYFDIIQNKTKLIDFFHILLQPKHKTLSVGFVGRSWHSICDGSQTQPSRFHSFSSSHWDDMRGSNCALSLCLSFCWLFPSLVVGPLRSNLWWCRWLTPYRKGSTFLPLSCCTNQLRFRPPFSSSPVLLWINASQSGAYSPTSTRQWSR